MTDTYLDPETTNVDEAISITLRLLSATREIHLAARYPGFKPYTFGYDKGIKYSRIWEDNGTQKMVCFFVQRDNGDVWKADGWKGPALNFTRGNIMTVEGRLAITLGKLSPQAGHFYPGF